jgi:hypothetical protein
MLTDVQTALETVKKAGLGQVVIKVQDGVIVCVEHQMGPFRKVITAK